MLVLLEQLVLNVSVFHRVAHWASVCELDTTRGEAGVGTISANLTVTVSWIHLISSKIVQRFALILHSNTLISSTFEEETSLVQDEIIQLLSDTAKHMPNAGANLFQRVLEADRKRENSGLLVKFNLEWHASQESVPFQKSALIDQQLLYSVRPHYFPALPSPKLCLSPKQIHTKQGG